MGSAAAATHG
uniref:Uncharacterized protein n=1 Tax=Arundo donax TaxID=35708 RepID=A0A0A9H460_ARUDO